MSKRSRMDIIKDILDIIKVNRNQIRYTPLLRKTNLSSSGFLEYYKELIQKGFITEYKEGSGKCVEITQKGEMFIEKYSLIKGFIEEFEL